MDTTCHTGSSTPAATTFLVLSVSCARRWQNNPPRKKRKKTVSPQKLSGTHTVVLPLIHIPYCEKRRRKEAKTESHSTSQLDSPEVASWRLFVGCQITSFEDVHIRYTISSRHSPQAKKDRSNWKEVLLFHSTPTSKQRRVRSVTKPPFSQTKVEVFDAVKCGASLWRLNSYFFPLPMSEMWVFSKHGMCCLKQSTCSN